VSSSSNVTAKAGRRAARLRSSESSGYHIADFPRIHLFSKAIRMHRLDGLIWSGIGRHTVIAQHETSPARCGGAQQAET
jgi:hypothetical protein